LKFMRCTRVEKFLPLHVAGDLKGRRAAHVANHLATCERCRDIAEEFNASRNLVRDAATLPPEFDNAFYEEIRRSVLDEITRTRRCAPPPSVRFASLFNTRFAYAASLALIIAAVAAISLHNYIGNKSREGADDNMLADTKLERAPRPTATPALTQAESDGRETSSPVKQTTREDVRRGAQQVANSSSAPRRAVKNANAQNEPQPESADLVKHAAPSHVELNRHARVVVAARAPTGAGEIATGNGETQAATEVSRIEIQTSDPNIRIIWLSPKPEDAITQPLK
jgi:hypothetical protein